MTTVTTKRAETHREESVCVLASFGLPAEALSHDSTEDLVALEAELDRFSAYGFGRASQRRFLHAPHAQLSGVTPAEALARRNGAASVLSAVRRSLAQLESKR